jgi:NADPH-dependent ferric siderophore reductase
MHLNPFVNGTVDEVAPVTSRMRRIRITGERLRGLSYVPGQHVRVNILPPGEWLRRLGDFGDARRTYSVWDYDDAAGAIELYVLDHGDGPGARWARTVQPGHPVSLSRPEGKLVPRTGAGVPYHLFAGDETAAVAFGAMLRTLADAEVYGVLEADSADDEVPLPGGHRITWVHRGPSRPGDPKLLLDAVKALDMPAEPGAAYLAGEARTGQAIMQHLVRERGWPRRQIVVKPFWTPGKKGLE